MKKKWNDKLFQVVISSRRFRDFPFCESDDQAENDCRDAREDGFKCVELRDHSWNSRAFEIIPVLFCKSGMFKYIFVNDSYQLFVLSKQERCGQQNFHWRKQKEQQHNLD